MFLRVHVCRLRGGLQRKVCPIAWASDIVILTYPEGKWSFVGNLSYRRTLSNPGSEFFFWQGGGGGGGGGGEGGASWNEFWA